MLFSRLFKQPKPNKFGYTPLYYDPKKEERERRTKDIEREVKASKVKKEHDLDSFRDRFSSSVSSARSAKTKSSFGVGGSTFLNSKSSVKLIVLIALLAVILFIQFKK